MFSNKILQSVVFSGIKCIKDVPPTMWAFLNWCIPKKGPLVPPPVRNGPLEAMIDKKLESLKKNTGRYTAAASQGEKRYEPFVSRTILPNC